MRNDGRQESQTPALPPGPPPTEPARRGRKLGTIRNNVRFVAAILRRLENDVPSGAALPVDRARVMLYGAQILGGLLQGSGLEREVDELRSMVSGYLDGARREGRA